MVLARPFFIGNPGWVRNGTTRNRARRGASKSVAELKSAIVGYP